MVFLDCEALTILIVNFSSILEDVKDDDKTIRVNGNIYNYSKLYLTLKRSDYMKINYFKKYDYLFTTGGIGPTHDDITAFAISKAFKRKYEYNKEAYQILERHYKDSYFNEARKKMAKMPRGAGLIYNPSSSAPGFYVKNVFTLPGVPAILQSMMSFIEKLIIRGEKVYSVTVQVNLPESKIGKDLGKLQKKFKDLSLGSYPFFQSGKIGTALVIRGYSEKKIQKCKIILDKILKKIKKS